MTDRVGASEGQPMLLLKNAAALAILLMAVCTTSCGNSGGGFSIRQPQPKRVKKITVTADSPPTLTLSNALNVVTANIVARGDGVPCLPRDYTIEMLWEAAKQVAGPRPARQRVLAERRRTPSRRPRLARSRREFFDVGRPQATSLFADARGRQEQPRDHHRRVEDTALDRVLHVDLVQRLRLRTLQGQGLRDRKHHEDPDADPGRAELYGALRRDALHAAATHRSVQGRHRRQEERQARHDASLPTAKTIAATARATPSPSALLSDPFPHEQSKPGYIYASAKVLKADYDKALPAELKDKLAIHVLGFGSKISANELADMTYGNGVFRERPATADLSALFDEITREIQSVQVVGAKIPGLVTGEKFSLVVRVRSRADTRVFGDIQYDFVAK